MAYMDAQVYRHYVLHGSYNKDRAELTMGKNQFHMYSHHA